MIPKEGLKQPSDQDRPRYIEDLEQQGLQASQLEAGRKEEWRGKALKKLERKEAMHSPQRSRPAISRPKSGGVTLGTITARAGFLCPNGVNY